MIFEVKIEGRSVCNQTVYRCRYVCNFVVAIFISTLIIVNKEFGNIGNESFRQKFNNFVGTN